MRRGDVAKLDWLAYASLRVASARNDDIHDLFHWLFALYSHERGLQCLFKRKQHQIPTP